MRGLGRPIARSPHRANHPLDKAVAVPQFLELLRGQLQSRPFHENSEALF